MCRRNCWSSVAASSGWRWQRCIPSLGSEVTVVEFMDQLIPGADADLIKPLAQRLAKRLKGIHLKTKVVEAKASKKGIEVSYEGDSVPETTLFDRVLVSVGRSPSGGKVGCRQGWRQRQRSRLYYGRQSDAHQRAAHLRHRRSGRSANAGAQGHARGQGRRRSGCRTQELLRRAGDSVGCLYRSGNRLGRCQRARSQREGPQGRRRKIPVGRQRSAPSATIAPKASPSCCSTRRPIASSVVEL